MVTLQRELQALLQALSQAKIEQRNQGLDSWDKLVKKRFTSRPQAGLQPTSFHQKDEPTLLAGQPSRLHLRPGLALRCRTLKLRSLGQRPPNKSEPLCSKNIEDKKKLEPSSIIGKLDPSCPRESKNQLPELTNAMSLLLSALTVLSPFKNAWANQKKSQRNQGHSVQ